MSGTTTLSPILVVEDHPGLRDVVVDAIAGEGLPVEAVDSVAGACELLRSKSFGFVITDLKLPDGSGLEVVAAARTAAVPVVVLSAFGNITTAVEAMKLGAIDFLEKPVALEELFAMLEAHLGSSEPNPAPFRAPGGPELVGSSPAFRGALRLLERAATTETTVLLLGESGTGKELFARSLHLLSARRAGPFVAVNCAAIPAQLVESELFGHEKGAFTGAHQRQVGRFEAAGGGTLFLDEVGELPLEIQAKVLRAVEERVIERVGGSRPIEVDLRLVTATNRELEQMVSDGSFRADLYYRLAIFPIRLPSLDQRRNDLPLLARHLLERAALRHQLRCTGFTVAALEYLQARRWPGNIRELANVIERAAILAEGDLLEVADLEPAAPPGSAPAGSALAGSALAGLDEHQRVTAALAASGGDHHQAAAALGISYRTLLRRLDALELKGSRWRR